MTCEWRTAPTSQATVTKVVEHYADEGDAARAALFVGVINLGAMLLEGLEHATGTPREVLLRDVAVRLVAGAHDDEEG